MSVLNNDRDADGHRVFREPQRTYARTPSGTTVEIERLPGRPPEAVVRAAGEHWHYRVEGRVARLLDASYSEEPAWIDDILAQVNVLERGPPIEDAEEEEG